MTQIKQINIENANSAFVEVAVATKATPDDDDFKILLPTTSFMTPTESKNIANGNRLKIFTNETYLNKEVSHLDSRVVKILCTQPFNKVLSFFL